MEKGKSILWYSLGPCTALVATAITAVDDDDGEKESVCAAKTGVWISPRGYPVHVVGSFRRVPFIADYVSCKITSAGSLAEHKFNTNSVDQSAAIFCLNLLMHALVIMLYCILLLLVAVAARANIYLPLMKDVERACNPLFGCIQEEDLWTDNLLRELIDQVGNEFVSVSDSYLEYQEDKAKELPMELPADYDSMDTLNPNPSIRDQEYLQHSTLWGHQRFENNKNNNDKGYDRHRIQSGLKGFKDEKVENPLPAYCTPPNPCPVGYTSENNCLTNFENTAAFSRDYQSAQDCMCDTEHMLECSNDSGNSNNLPNIHISNSDLNQIVEQFQEENPFFQGEKLPIAAKKGIHVID